MKGPPPRWVGGRQLQRNAYTSTEANYPGQDNTSSIEINSRSEATSLFDVSASGGLDVRCWTFIFKNQSSII